MKSHPSPQEIAEHCAGERLEAARRADCERRAARQARADAWLPGLLHAHPGQPFILEWWSLWTRRMGTLASLAGFGVLILGCLQGWVEVAGAGIALMALCQRGWFLPMTAITPLLVWSGRCEAALHRWILRWAQSQGLRAEAGIANRMPRKLPRMRSFL